MLETKEPEMLVGITSALTQTQRNSLQTFSYIRRRRRHRRCYMQLSNPLQVVAAAIQDSKEINHNTKT